MPIQRGVMRDVQCVLSSAFKSHFIPDSDLKKFSRTIQTKIVSLSSYEFDKEITCRVLSTIVAREMFSCARYITFIAEKTIHYSVISLRFVLFLIYILSMELLYHLIYTYDEKLLGLFLKRLFLYFLNTSATKQKNV